MTPIERVRAKANAAATLNVSASATREELRKAWKKAAFQYHPDQTGGDIAAFREVETAYRMLNGDIEPDAVRPRTRVTPSRPASKGYTTEIPDDVLTRFEGVLRAHNMTGKVSHRLRVAGKHLTYFVKKEMVEGETHLVLAKVGTGDKRNSYKPWVVNVAALTQTDSGFAVPRNLLETRFPDVASVNVRVGD